VLLLGCVPLAGLTAYLATRRLVTATAARLWLAASYALLPVASGAVAAGRLGTAFAFALLPLIGVSAGRMVTAPPRPARRAAWATGLLVALAAAFAPLAWVFAAVFAAVMLAVRLVFAGRPWAVSPVNAAIVVGTPFAVLFPWSFHLLASPSAFLTEAGVQSPGLTTAGLRPSALLLLSPGGPGLPPVWVTAGIGLAVLAALLPHRRTGLTAAGWCVAAAGFLGAVMLSRTTVTPAGGGQAASGWPGVALAVAALGLLLAAAPAAQWLAGIVSGGSGAGTGAAPGAVRRLLAGVTLAAAATAPVLAAGYWVADGVRGPVGSVTTQVLPAFVSASATAGTQYRTLILRPEGDSLAYSVVRQSDPTLGEPELAASAPAQQALSRQVAALGAPDGADAGDPGLVLGQFGIRWVLVPGPVNQALAQRLDATVGLVPRSSAPAYDLWEVAGPVARVRVTAPDGTVTPLASQAVGMSGVSAPVAGGTLVLAEPHGGWTATLNGTALKPLAGAVDGWAQGFVLPPGGGRLVITRNNLARGISLVVELIALLAVCVLALPGKRADPTAEAEALAAVRAAQHSRRAPLRRRQRSAPHRRWQKPAPLRRWQKPAEEQTQRSGHAGRRALQAASAGRAAAGPGTVRSSAEAPETVAADHVPTGAGVGVLADADESARAEQWDQMAQSEETGVLGESDQWDDHDQGSDTGQRDDLARLTGPRPAAPRGTGPQPTAPWETGPQATARRDTGPQAPVAPTGPQSAEMPPWETGDWGRASEWSETPAWYEPPGRSGGSAANDAPGRSEPPSWNDPSGLDKTPGRDDAAVQDERSGASERDSSPRRDKPVRRAQSAGRHSHRAGKRGRPGRRRGSDDHSGSEDRS
jgi:hypothetical protein